MRLIQEILFWTGMILGVASTCFFVYGILTPPPQRLHRSKPPLLMGTEQECHDADADDSD